MTFRWMHPKRTPPSPSTEALHERAEVEALKPRVYRAVREREQLLRENNYAARIRALYQGSP